MYRALKVTGAQQGYRQTEKACWPGAQERPSGDCQRLRLTQSPQAASLFITFIKSKAWQESFKGRATAEPEPGRACMATRGQHDHSWDHGPVTEASWLTSVGDMERKATEQFHW